MGKIFLMLKLCKCNSNLLHLCSFCWTSEIAKTADPPPPPPPPTPKENIENRLQCNTSTLCISVILIHHYFNPSLLPCVSVLISHLLLHLCISEDLYRWPPLLGISKLTDRKLYKGKWGLTGGREGERGGEGRGGEGM